MGIAVILDILLLLVLVLEFEINSDMSLHSWLGSDLHLDSPLEIGENLEFQFEVQLEYYPV